MSYRGRPSKGCESCRTKKVKCDETKPVCSRCSKTGHECKYRDQADLLFRNQTAVAAQKAEDSWRKRSKPRQRIGSESNVNSQSWPKNQHSLQNAPLSHSTNRSEESVTTEPRPAYSSVLDPLELSIPGQVGVGLRRVAYERFLYDFVVFETPNKPPEAMSDALWDFIPDLYQRAPEGSCLATVVDAVAYSNFANRRNAPQAQALGVECLGKAIKLLQKTIADKEQAPTDEALCSVYLMGIYGSLTSPTKGGSYLAHSQGASALLQLRSMDEYYTNTVSARLYEVSLVQMLVSNLQRGKRPPVSVENVVATRKYLPNFYSASGICVLRLIHEEAELHAKWHETKHSSTPPTNRGDLQELLRTALELDAEFQAWESSLPREWRYGMERNTPDARCTYESKWRNLLLESQGAPEEIHTYTTLRRCWIWTFYRTTRIFALRDLLEILNWMFKLPEPIQASDPMPNNTTSGALDNTGLQVHHSFATTHMVNLMEKSCSAVLGTMAVPIYGKSDQDVVGLRGFIMMWSLGTMDSILKAGLIPDAAVPPTPPNSNEASPYTRQTPSPLLIAPAPSPAVFRMPVRNIHPLYQQGPVSAPQPNAFARLPPIPTEQSAPPSAGPTPAAIRATGEPGSQGHVFDTSPPHAFDSPTHLPDLDFTITKPARIDVAARREWLNRILYYIASELGIKQAIAVPFMEGYFETCKAQVEALLTQ
ncbi:hypothetical protein K458DRAFT_288220 [Lentithecium fluviatile CBS 122367]|uniref:Zn(2)-C6 fungal-type domain-containing protein n=1 Tax=Lentithecium fluviatile CBS 122367 TaxID=1168545 RepID=A0A6G1JL33_9PLEO|nr:hypothetical protein K458DRAFT_288220 [Lentithecium fluviatile CBS 122367]